MKVNGEAGFIHDSAPVIPQYPQFPQFPLQGNLSTHLLTCFDFISHFHSHTPQPVKSAPELLPFYIYMSQMLTTKNYSISSSQQKVNLNYAAVGQITDHKSHRFLKFGLRLHLSLENLNCVDSNNSLPLTQPSHLHENHQPPAFSTSGSGVNSLRELSWETTGMEQQLRERVTQFGNQLSSLRSRVPTKVNELIDSGKDYAKSNPLTFLTLVALVFSCSLPVLVFLAFAVFTVAVTFIGFLFVEGTILTVASVVLTSTLLLVGFFTLTVTALLILTYLALNVSYRLLTGSPLSETNPISAIVQFLSSAGVHNNGEVVNHTDELSSEEEVAKEVD